MVLSPRMTMHNVILTLVREILFGAIEQPSLSKLPVLVRITRSTGFIFDLHFDKTSKSGFRVLIDEWWEGNVDKWWCGRRRPR
jgi:hypothetical protein